MSVCRRWLIISVWLKVKAVWGIKVIMNIWCWKGTTAWWPRCLILTSCAAIKEGIVKVWTDHIQTFIRRWWARSCWLKRHYVLASLEEPICCHCNVEIFLIYFKLWVMTAYLSKRGLYFDGNPKPYIRILFHRLIYTHLVKIFLSQESTVSPELRWLMSREDCVW